MRIAVAVVALAMPLAASSQADDRFALGRWEQVSTINGVTLDGQPIEANVPPPETAYICVATAADAVPATFFGQLQQEECTAERSSVAGGRVTLVANCRDPDGGPLRMEMTGSYAKESYALGFTRISKVPQGTIRATGRIAAKRVGACRGDE